MSNLKQAQVIYYLCRGGVLEHPHLIDVGYLEHNGLLLRDVKRRLVAIRGRRMPDTFSWSYKREYRNDFIWHDVSNNDIILPMNGSEYILKGSEIESLGNDYECKTMVKDLNECIIDIVKTYKTRTSSEHNNDAATQTEDEQHKDKLSLTPSFTSSLTPSFTPINEQSRAEKPSPCISKFHITQNNTEENPPKIIENTSETVKIKRTHGLIFRNKIPCGNVGVKLRQPNDKLNETKNYNNITRYRPRHSFSNSDYFDGYDLRKSSASSRMSVESLYEVDCKTAYGNTVEENTYGCTKEEHAKFEKESWWEFPQERICKSKRDWEKNLQDAVNMIIHPPQHHLETQY